MISLSLLLDSKNYSENNADQREKVWLKSLQVTSVDPYNTDNTEEIRRKIRRYTVNNIIFFLVYIATNIPNLQLGTKKCVNVRSFIKRDRIMKYNLGNGTAEKALFLLAGFSWIDPEKGWYHFRFRPTLMTSVTSGLLPVNTRNKSGKN